MQHVKVDLGHCVGKQAFQQLVRVLPLHGELSKRRQVDHSHLLHHQLALSADWPEPVGASETGPECHTEERDYRKSHFSNFQNLFGSFGQEPLYSVIFGLTQSQSEDAENTPPTHTHTQREGMSTIILLQVGLCHSLLIKLKLLQDKLL